MKTRLQKFRQTIFIGSLAFFFAFLSQGSAANTNFLAQVKNIIHDKQGNVHQEDSNGNVWVSVDGKNFNTEVRPEGPLTEKEWEALSTQLQKEKIMKKIKGNIHFYEMIFNARTDKQLASHRKPDSKQFVWNPESIIKNHKVVTKTGEKRSALADIIEDKNNVLYQVDSNGRIWVSIDRGKNWNEKISEGETI